MAEFVLRSFWIETGMCRKVGLKEHFSAHTSRFNGFGIGPILLREQFDSSAQTAVCTEQQL